MTRFTVFLLIFSLLIPSGGYYSNIVGLPKLSLCLTVFDRATENDTPEMNFKPSKYFEVVSGNLVFYKWDYLEFTDQKGNKINKTMPAFEDNKQVLLSPSSPLFFEDVSSQPACCSNFSSTLKQSFELLIKDNYNHFKYNKDDKVKYYMQQLYVDQHDFEQFAGTFACPVSKLFSDDVIIITKSYEVSRWNRKGHDFVLTKVEALNPDLMEKQETEVLENMFLFRYCKYSWNQSVNLNNKSYGFVCCKAGEKFCYSRGKKANLVCGPEIKDNRFMYPMSSLARDLDFSYNIEGSLMNIHREKKNSADIIDFSINTDNWSVMFDNKVIQMNPTPYLIDDEWMLPLRSICDLLDAAVYWRDCDKSVLIERF